MKQSVLIIFSLFFLIACSPYNHLQTREQNGLKTVRFAQSLQSNFLNTNKNLSVSPAIKVNTIYRYEEKDRARPVVSLDLKGEKLLADSLVFINLDGENVQLSFLEGSYRIAENLWVPIVHAQHVQYRLKTNDDQLVLTLNDKQKDQLIEFFNKAIQLRDEIFPAVPPGKKKW